MTIEPMNLTHCKVLYTVKPDFTTVEDMIDGMVQRIKVKIGYLGSSTGASAGMLAMQYREIRGMIALLESVCDANDLHNDLVVQLIAARQTANDNIGK